MASFQTDEERERRYAELRKKKKWSDILCGIPILIGVFIFLSGVFALLSTFMDVAMGGSILAVLRMLCPLIASGTAVACIFSRRMKLVLVAFAAVAVMDVISGSSVSLIMIPAMIPGIIGVYIWSKLEEEEGFPLFRIPLDEIRERQQNAEKRSRYRAEQIGTRRAADGEIRGGMGDLLDASEDVPVQTSVLQGYFERSANAQGEFSIPQSEAAGEYGKMDEL